MGMANNSKKDDNKKGAPNGNRTVKLTGHSATLHQRITVVPGRVYIHPIPQFLDNIAYLVVCTPPREAPALPLVAILIDCGESDKVLNYVQRIYEHHYMRDYPTCNGRIRNSLGGGSFVQRVRKTGIELYAVLCTHRHHDHTAGVKGLKRELTRRRTEEGDADLVVGRGDRGSQVNGSYEGAGRSVYENVEGNVVVVGGAVEQVPHCNLYAKNGCFVPLPCISLLDDDGVADQVNDMNALVSVEVIGVPSHTRGSVVYALRNRPAPGVGVRNGPQNSPLRSHLFTGDAIFTGGGGVPFEADLEFASDNFVKNPKSLRGKNGSSKFRPGAGTLSLERCFAEVLTRASGPWSSRSSSDSPPNLPQDAVAGTSSHPEASSQTTLLYPGHEYTTDLLMRQFDQKTIPSDGYWTRLAPSVFFTTASHYLVSAHRRALPQGQKLLTVPTPLDREQVVNPNFRSLRRRGEMAAHALKLWYEFGAKTLIPERDVEGDGEGSDSNKSNGSMKRQSVFTTVYSAELDEVVQALRSGVVTATSAADRIESLKSSLDERIIKRRPIPSTLPSHKNVYLGVVAMAVLGSAPSAMTVSDANIMGMAPPAENTDRLLISKRRVSSV